MPPAAAENIKVIVRVRPANEREVADGEGVYRKSVEVSGNSLTYEGAKPFTFDGCCDEDSTQEQIFEQVGKPMTDSCLDGYNATIFAYGQTGSGKTWTMEGGSERPEEVGLIPRVFEHLFSRVSEKRAKGDQCSVKVSVSYLEIYNETFTDLLNPGGVIKLRENSGRREGVQMEGATEMVVNSAAETFAMLKEGSEYRHVAATNMNKESSRSHSVFIMKIQTTQSIDGRKSVRTSRFNLIDLAGSERQKTAKTAGKELKEASAINKSLSALGNVINALVDKANGKERHIHYRDSKLTFLLKDSLGGNSKTCIITNVSPAGKNSEETLSTLRFAQRAKKIQNAAVVNEITSGEAAVLQAAIEQLKQEKESLEQQLAAGTTGVQGKSNEEMEQMLQHGFKQHAQMKQENEELAEQLAVATSNVAKVVKAAQAKDMIIKFRDNKIQQLEKGLGGDKSQFEYEHQAELDALRKFKATNPELGMARLENKNLRKKVKELQSDEVREQMVSAMEELKSYNNDLVRQCAEFGKQKEAMEANMQEVEDMIETQIADLARVRAENQDYEKMIASLQGSKSELESMIEETMNLLETSQNDHNACKADLERVSAEASAWESKSSALEQQLEQKTSELEASQQNVTQLEQDLAGSKAEVATVTDTMNQNLAAHKQQVDKLTDECESIKNELAAAIRQHETSVATLNSQVGELQSAVTAEQEAVKEQQQLVKTLEDSQQQLKDDAANREQQLQTAEAKITERDAEIETLTSAKNETEQKLVTAESAVATHESMIEALEAEKRELATSLEAKQQEMSNAAAESEKMQADFNEKLAAQQTMIDAAAAAEKSLEAAEAKITERDAEIETLTSAKNETEQKLVTAESAVATHESMIAALEAEKRELATSLEAKQQEMSNAAAESEKMQADFNEKLAAQQTMIDAAAAAEKSLEAAEAKITERDAEIETLTSAKNETEQKLVTAESAVATHESMIAALEAEKRDLTSQTDSLSEALKLKEASLEASQASVQDYVGKVTVMAEELNSAQVELTAAVDKAAGLETAKEELSETLATTRGFMSDAVSDAQKVQRELKDQIAALQAEKEQDGANAARTVDMEKQILELTAEKEAAEAATSTAKQHLNEAKDQLKVSMQAAKTSEAAVEQVAALGQELDDLRKRATEQSAENLALRSELEETKAQVAKLNGGTDASGAGDNTKQKIQHLEKVKRELAEIKDVKSQLEKELARKDRQLQDAEQHPLEIVQEESPEEIDGNEDDDDYTPSDDENQDFDASEEPTGIIPTAALRKAAAAVYEFSEDDDGGSGKSESEVVMRPRKTRRALATLSENSEPEKKQSASKKKEKDVVVVTKRRASTRRSARTRGAAALSSGDEGVSPPKRRRAVA